MRIPDSVKVGPFIYTVEWPEIVDRGNRDLIGEADHNAFTIKVERGLRPEKAEEVFLHELIHCVDVFMQVGLNEDQVTRLSNGLYMVLKANGLLNEGEPNQSVSNVIPLDTNLRSRAA